MKSLEIKKDIYWVGALDPNLRIFDIIMYTPYGTTYNSYVVKGSEKIAVLETVKEAFFEEYLERLNSLNIDVSKIDYIIVDHTEPDHAGSVAKLLSLSPKAKVVGSAAAIRFLKNIANRDFSYITVNDGDTLSLGNKTLKFISAPFLHWPDSIYTYIEEDRVLMTCDSFGSHYSTNNVFNDKIENEENYMEALKYYYDCIMGPFKPYVLKAIDKIKNLDLQIVCPGHGPILRDNPHKIIDLYKLWSTKEENLDFNKKVTISYVSAYGYTEELAKEISRGIKSVGPIDVTLFNVIYEETNTILKSIENSEGILFGSPTINGDLLEPIRSLLTHLNPIVHGLKFAGAFGSYGWSGEAVPNIDSRLKELRMICPVESLRVVFKPSEQDLINAFNYGVNFANCIINNITKMPLTEETLQKQKTPNVNLSDSNSSTKTKKWKCLVCNEVFEGEFPPNICPVCSADSESFVEIFEEEAKFQKPTSETFVIIGNGAAGYNCALSIRKNNPTALIKIVSKENTLTYYRPMLSDYLSENIKDSDFYLSSMDFYKNNNIDLLLNKEVLSVDTEKTILYLNDNSTLSYNKLIFANGSENFIPNLKGTNLKGVFSLKTKKNADEIIAYSNNCKKAILVGGGLLGLEAAYELSKKNIQVTVVELATRLLPRQLDEEGSSYFKENLVKSDLEVILNDSIVEILSKDESDKVSSVKLKSGICLDCDLVLFSVGISPNKMLAKECLIPCDKGILVNSRMETSKPNIYACGDVAQVNGTLYGNWTLAAEMGKVAGKNSSGENIEIKTFFPSTMFNAFNCEVFTIGTVNFENVNKESIQEICLRNPGKSQIQKLFFKEGILAGAYLIGDLKKAPKLILAIESSVTLDDLYTTDIF